MGKSNFMREKQQNDLSTSMKQSLCPLESEYLVHVSKDSLEWHKAKSV